MRLGINLKIDVTSIDKDKLFKGKKGTYLDATTFIDLDNKGEYGDNGFIAQAVSKEDKENGVQGVILGNSTVFWREDVNAVSAAKPSNDFDDSDSIPF